LKSVLPTTKKMEDITLENHYSVEIHTTFVSDNDEEMFDKIENTFDISKKGSISRLKEMLLVLELLEDDGLEKIYKTDSDDYAEITEYIDDQGWCVTNTVMQK
jgi:hypothetical protein